MYLLQVKSSSDWALFWGHFHPVFVHLPIGILFIAFVLEMVRLKTRNLALDNSVSIILFWGFVSAIVSCLFGWLLSSSGEYDEETLFWHQWMGIGVAVLAGVLWILKIKKNKGIVSGRFYSYLITGTVVLLMATGHLGGNMTHGEDYLTMHTPEPLRGWMGIEVNAAVKERAPITDMDEALVYADIIAPIFETNCTSCHNAGKKKGGLRMDTEEWLMKGGKHGLVIKAGDVSGSEIIKRLLLPKGDDERMPPKGKPAPDADEIELIKWWIASGASFKSKVKDLAKTTSVEPWFNKHAGTDSLAAAGQADSTRSEHSLSAVYLEKIPLADKSLTDALKKENLIVSPISQNQSLLEISAVNRTDLKDETMKLIGKLSLNVAWLKLSNTKITDAGLKEIAACRNLVRLNIEHTSVTGKSVGILKQFAHLEYLNITGTSMDDQSLLELASIKSLRNIYCWQTSVTTAGIEAFKKINPRVHIELGGEYVGNTADNTQ